MSNSELLRLTGCRPEPLLSYLKAVGLLRLVGEQAAAEALGRWRAERFELGAGLDADELEVFLLDEYRPSPVLAPWNKSSGFWAHRWAKNAHRATHAAEEADHPRLAIVSKALGEARSVLAGELGMDREEASDRKEEVLEICRSRLPDEAVRWIDAVAVLTEDGAVYPPALGTGGNDARLEFTAKYYSYLRRIIPFSVQAEEEAGDQEYERGRSRGWLQLALWGEIRDGGDPPPLLRDKVGQFHPGGVGGPNATAGFEAESLINPWDFVLGMEGLLLLAGASSRRAGADRGGFASVPFTTRGTAAGYATASSPEEFGRRRGSPDIRGELWLPLWSRPAGDREIAHLFAEGRAQLGRRQARTGVEFARAIARLGVDRGISEFRRFGFVQRSGSQNHLALPLGRFRVRRRAEARLLDEIDPWLNRFRRACRRGVPGRYESALRRIDRAVLASCAHGGRRRFQDVLAALGRAERTLARAPLSFLNDEGLPPLQGLSTEWVEACDDGTATYRLACSAASLWEQGDVGAIRSYLEPVVRGDGRWRWQARSPRVSWSGGRLAESLEAVLARRTQEGLASTDLDHLPLRGWAPVAPSDVHRFLEGQVREDRLSDLLWGLAAVDWDGEGAPDPPDETVPPDLPRPYALLKLLFLGGSYETAAGESIRITPEPRVLALLRSGRVPEACEVAMRRLRAHRLRPLGTGQRRPGAMPEMRLSRAPARRLAGALLFPVHSIRRLAALVVEEPAASAV